MAAKENGKYEDKAGFCKFATTIRETMKGIGYGI